MLFPHILSTYLTKSHISQNGPIPPSPLLPLISDITYSQVKSLTPALSMRSLRSLVINSNPSLLVDSHLATKTGWVLDALTRPSLPDKFYPINGDSSILL